MSNTLFDLIMPIFHKPNLISIIFLLAICIIIFNKNLNQKLLNKRLKNYKFSPIMILSFIFLTIIITDQTGRAIKSLELRDRPWANKTTEQVNCLTCKLDKTNPNLYLTNSKGANKSFPSNHAANSFAIAFVISFFFPKIKNKLYLLAFIISFSRIYIGVHYPFDIMYGMCLGLLAGYLVISIFNLYIKIKS